MNNNKETTKTVEDKIIELKTKLFNKTLIEAIKNEDIPDVENVSAKITPENIFKVQYKYYGEDNGQDLMMKFLGYNYSDFDSKYIKSEERMLFIMSFEIDLNKEKDILLNILYALAKDSANIINKEDWDNKIIPNLLEDITKQNKISNFDEFNELLLELNINVTKDIENVKNKIEKLLGNNRKLEKQKELKKELFNKNIIENKIKYKTKIDNFDLRL